MMRTAWILGSMAMVSALAVGGCGSGDPFARIESTYDGMIDHVCRACPTIGAPTEAECRAAAAADNPFSGAAWECQRRVYGQYPDELAPTYDCIARAVSMYDACLRDAVRTCPPVAATTQMCSDRLNSAINACPRPDSIMASSALGACF
jgi:hypothetical protein